MKILEVMTTDPKFCTPQTNLAEATALMWAADCGVLPVVGRDSKVVIGVVTDRDMMVAVGTRNLRPSELTVESVMTSPALTCKPGDDVDDAMSLMAAQKVRRLPVVNVAGELLGMLALNDVALCADRMGGSEATKLNKGVLSTLKTICARRQLKAATAAAA